MSAKFDYNKYSIEKLFVSVPELRFANNTKDLVEEFFKELPKLQATHEVLKKEMGYELEQGVGAYIIYEDIFCSFILDLINKKNLTEHEQDILKRSFELIEELAKHEDFDVRCLAQVGFLERLIAEIKPTKSVEKYLLPKSLELAREIGQSSFGFNPKTWKKIKTVQGKVPGSKAVYEKFINSKGQTVKYHKTTYGPDGSVVHIKDKINNTMNTFNILTNLINLKKPLSEIKTDVSKLSWDEDCNVILTEKILNKIINKYLNGVISESELIEWANLIESRESINFEKGKEVQIAEIIFNIANPELGELPLKYLLEKFRD